MAANRAESSSDLERARELSRRLQPGSAPPTEAPDAAPRAGRPGFSAAQARGFGGASPARGPAAPPAAPASPGPAPAQVVASPPAAPAAAPAVPPRPPASPAAARPALPAPPASGSWEELLGWCRTALAAEAAFIVDLRGLLVANSGTLSDDDAQAMGARLVAALAQADELEGAAPVRALVVDLAARCLTGIRLLPASGDPLAVGLLSARPLAAGAAALIRKAFSGKLAGA